MKKILRSEEQIFLQSLLKEARHSVGLTQEHLATKIGKPQSFIAKYETGERLLNVIEFMYVLKALDQNPSSFVTQLDAKISEIENI